MIFVTGGTGFLGTHLLRSLVLSGHPVRALKRRHSKILLEEDLNKAVEWVEGNILDIPTLEQSMDGCDEVYHCAAMVSFQPKHRGALMRVNVEGTANVVNVALEQKIRKMMYVSSVAAIGRRGSNVIRESTEWENSNFNSNYGISKYLAEREVWRGIAEGLSAVIVNPTVIIGDGNWKEGTPRFFLNVWKGMPAYTSGGTGFVAADDVAAIMIQLMKSNIENERFIINAENLKFKDLFSRIADVLGKKRPYLHATPWIMELVWRWETIRSTISSFPPFISREIARNAGCTYHFDASKIRQAIDFQFTPIENCIESTGKKFLDDTKAGKIK